MELYVLRHGIAAERGTYADDGRRPLTPEGTAKMRKIAAAFGPLGVRVGMVLSSPLVRARQTADIAAEALDLPVTIVEELSAGAPPADIVEAIEDHVPEDADDEAAVMIVGHEPDLSRLVSLLVSGNDWSGVRMKKGGLCKLTIGELRVGPCAILEWLLWPKQLVRIAT